jgi:hypothetical protein
VKHRIIRSAENAKKLNAGKYLTSWKEIAQYMRCGVRTVQRYERESGLPIRRPTGKSRGSVMATRAEIDAWIVAAPIRETFKLSRVMDSQTQTRQLESGVVAMRKLKEQMLALRIETRTAMNLLIDRVSAVRLLFPSSSPDGYEPLINNNNMDMDMDMKRRLHLSGGKGNGIPLNSAPADSLHKDEGQKRNKPSISTAPKPH